jgi:formate-dependent nitrite reductase membrane component NrfD
MHRPEPSPRTLRQFAAAWLLFISVFGAQQYFGRGRHSLGLACILAALVFGISGLLKPATVHWLFVTLMFVAFPIGWLISQVMLAVMFYLILTPIALVFRLIGRDVLLRRRAPGRSSFWLPKPRRTDLRSYFRQY